MPGTSRRRRQVDSDENNVEEPIEIRAEEPRTGAAREKKRSVLLVGFFPVKNSFEWVSYCFLSK